MNTDTIQGNLLGFRMCDLSIQITSCCKFDPTGGQAVVLTTPGQSVSV